MTCQHGCTSHVSLKARLLHTTRILSRSTIGSISSISSAATGCTTGNSHPCLIGIDILSILLRPPGFFEGAVEMWIKDGCFCAAARLDQHQKNFGEALKSSSTPQFGSPAKPALIDSLRCGARSNKRARRGANPPI